MWVYIIATAILALAVWKLFFSKPKPPTFNPGAIKFEPSTKLPSLANIRKEAKTQKPGQIRARILFGSQTGTAEDFANVLGEEAASYNFFPDVVDLEQYDTSDLEEEQFVIFVLATYGEGEPTDNAKEFYEWLMDDEREVGMFSKVKYTVFGLGNKTYEHFNAVSRRVDARMEELGATRIFQLGEGDDDAGLQEDFDRWKGKLWQPICKALGVEFKSAEVSISPTFELVVCDANVKLSQSVTWYTKGINREVIDVKNPGLFQIQVTSELHTSKSDRSCRHIEVELPGNLSYQPGDYLGIYPENDPAEVQKWIEKFQLNPHQIIKIVKKDDPNRPLAGPCSVERLLTAYVDILSAPKKKLLHALALLYTSNEKEKERLVLLGSSTEEGWHEYNEYIKNPNRTLLEVLADFPSCKPEFVHVVELTNQLTHRFYSIASSLKEHPKSVHIAAVVSRAVTATGRVHNGICTSWLAKKKAGDTVPCFLRASTFRMPKDPSTPLIMIGPGTGLAPFRGFLQERRATKASGYAILFFGCQARDVDFLYDKDLHGHLQDGSLNELILAFSREGPQKVYVQHRMLEHKEKLWNLLEKGAHVYVCGDAKYMAKDVHKALRTIVEEAGGKNKQEAESYITALQTSLRYQQDVWT